jgi:hypothetical protein
MSEFRNRLRSIREQAEEKASRLGASLESREDPSVAEAQRFRDFASRVGDVVEELAGNFIEEFSGFENIRVAMDTGHCIRLSRLEDLEGSRKLTRLTFTIETVDTSMLVKIACKGIVFNRERGHDELELQYPVRAESPGAAAGETPASTDVLLGRVREFAEKCLLEFATGYEDARMSSQWGAH